MTFDELYKTLLKKTVNGEEIPGDLPEEDYRHLDCLLHPDKYAPVWAIEDCTECNGEKDCCSACLFNAIQRQDDGKIVIDPSGCSGCASCINACQSGKLTASRDILPALDSIKHADGKPVYALIAPAFIGQFSKDVTPGKLRSAFKALGFTGMVEVALAADILTMKEALEFDHNIRSINDFQMTSCCCPVWISLIRKVYKQLIPHVPGAVSPMIAAGRIVKVLHPDAITIFIGPCLAKKAEAKEPDLKGDVDWVLTFQEIRDIFEAADIHPENLEDTEKGHSSRAGRIYAYSGGVSQAVGEAVERLYPDRTIQVEATHADGVPDCKAMIDRILNEGSFANFYEGMGCNGGCVGGPRVIIDKEEGKEHVVNYGDEAEYITPFDNPYVIKLLGLLGFETVEDFLKNSHIFVRDLHVSK